MCANTLNTNLKIKHEKQTEEHFSINERRLNRQNDAEKKVCILNKRISKRSQNINTVNPQISLFRKSNKKVIEKNCYISTISKFVVSCRFCKGNFDTVEKCQNHVCTVTKPQALLNESEIYKCHLCLMLFKERSALDEHLKNHNHNNCNYCDAQFSMYKELCKHLKNVHSVTGPDKLYLCAICKKSFDKKETLNLHTKSHITATCNQCGDKVTDVEHMKIHLQNKCHLCNKMFADTQLYNQHMMIHRKHVCELCNITYTTYKLLKKHQHDLHDVRVSKRHQCEICDKCFNRPLHLIVHKRVHTGEKPLKCLDCNKNYYSNKTFTKHLKTIRHLKKVSLSNEIMVGKKYACEKCEGRFFNLQDLQRHVQILHSNEEPLKCDHCTYSTKCKANLKRHSEIHSQTKRFACELCNQTFRSHGNLKDHHAFIHSDKREFLCNICNKSFKVNRDLQRHKKIHSDDKPYKCSCTCSFRRLSHLKRHKLSCKHVDFDKLAQTDELNKNMLDDDLESCDDPIQFSNNNNSGNLILEPEVISSSYIPNNSESILASNDLCLPYNDKASKAAVLHSLSKTIEHSVVTLTDTVSTKNISTSLLPNVFENPITTHTNQISIENVNLSCSAVNWIDRIPSQTTTMPLITTLVTPPVMASKTSKPPETTSSTIVTASVELPLVSFAENISLSSVVEQPVTNFIGSNLTSNSTSMLEMTTSIDKPASDVIDNSVSVMKVQEEPLASNEETHQCVSQTLPHISSESISTNLDNNSLNNFTASNVLNTPNCNQPLLQNIPAIIVPKSAVKEYPNPLQTYSIITQDLDDQLLIDKKYILCSIPKSRNLVSTDLSNIEHKRYSKELLEQTNVLVPLSSSLPKTLSVPYSSLQPVNIPLNVDSVDENLNQLPHLFNLDNIMGSLNNSVENLVSDYPVSLNNLIFSNEALLNSLLNNAEFESPS